MREINPRPYRANHDKENDGVCEDSEKSDSKCLFLAVGFFRAGSGFLMKTLPRWWFHLRPRVLTVGEPTVARSVEA